MRIRTTSTKHYSLTAALIALILTAALFRQSGAQAADLADLAHKLQQLQKASDYQQFQLETPFGAKAVPNLDWYATHRSNDADEAVQEAKDILQGYEAWRSEKERGIQELEKEASQIPGTAKELRQQLVEHLKATAKGESPDYSIDYQQINADDTGLSIDSTFRDSRGVSNEKAHFPWAALASAEIRVFRYPNGTTFQVLVTTKELTMTRTSHKQGEPDTSSQTDQGEIVFPTSSAARKAALLLCRAAGKVTGAPGLTPKEPTASQPTYQPPSRLGDLLKDQVPKRN
jgi:hypothetical protein